LAFGALLSASNGEILVARLICYCKAPLAQIFNGPKPPKVVGGYGYDFKGYTLWFSAVYIVVVTKDGTIKGRNVRK